MRGALHSRHKMMLVIKRIRAIIEAFSSKERMAFWGTLGCLVVGILFLASYAWDNVTKIVPAQGGTHTEGIVGQPAYVNPVIANSETDKELVRLLFSNIITLSEKTESSKDKRTWTVRLKENLYWSDGARLTSDDVVYTVQKIQDAESGSLLFSVWQGVLPRRISEQEIEFRLGAPYAFFEQALASLYPIPKHIFETVPPQNWKIAPSRLEPVGSGPYVFATSQIDKNGFVAYYTLRTNEYYAGTAPLIPQFTFQFFGTKEDALAAFNLGHIDGIGNLTPTDLASIQRPYEIHAVPLPGYYAVFMNQGKNLALQDSAVRTALSLVIDRNALVKEVLGGGADPLTAPFVIATREEPKAFPVNEAAQMLEIAGWKLGENGMREKTERGGMVPLKVTLTVPEGTLSDVARTLASAWGKIGITVELRTLPLEEISELAIKNRDYEMLLFGHVLNYSLDLYPFWHSAERFFPGANLSLYHNARVDTLIEEIRTTIDEAARDKKTAEVTTLIEKDTPAIFLYTPSYLYVSTKDLRGIETALIKEPADRFLGTPLWHLRTARILK